MAAQLGFAVWLIDCSAAVSLHLQPTSRALLRAQASGQLAAVPRRLLANAAWMHPSFAHGANAFGSGGITAQQENMEDVIAAQIHSATRPGGGRRLLSASELLQPPLPTTREWIS